MSLVGMNVILFAGGYGVFYYIEYLSNDIQEVDLNWAMFFCNNIWVIFK